MNMTNRESLFSAALAQKRAAAEQYRRQAAKRRAELYVQNPRLAEIDTQISEYGAQVAMTAFSGDRAGLSVLQEKITALAAEKSALVGNAPIEPAEDCPVCHDTGYVDGKLCDCVKSLAKKLAMEHLSDEMPLHDCRFDNFDLSYYPNRETDGVNPHKKMTTVFKFCREYALNFDPKTAANLLFLGGVGLGKTHLTLAIVSEVIQKGYDVIYGSAFNLLSAVEREHFSNTRDESYESMLACDLLVIDDLGTEFTSPFTLSVLYNLINSRILTRKPTIINTNLPLSEVEKRYSSRIASRLIGSYDAHKFFGSDIRQIKASRPLNKGIL